MTEMDLADRFPHMKPIDSAPSLYRANGCGMGVYGSRDLDPETGTYVTTYCLCVLWIPILALRAYRVARAEDGWLFLGREPLSAFAKLWDLVLVAGVLSVAAALGLNAYTASPEYRAGQQLAEANTLAAEGELVEAAQLYRTVITGGTSRASDAEAAFGSLVDGPMRDAPARDAAAILEVVVELHQRRGENRVMPDPFEEGMALAEGFAELDPYGASAVLAAIEPLAQDADAIAHQREQLLERAVAKEPNNPDPACELAVIYEPRGELEKCESLLAPHKDRLGATEGARILGQIYARQGDPEASFVLLLPYTEQRLTRLHEAEKAYNNAFEQAWTRAIEELEQGDAPASFYTRYEAASEAKQQAMAQEYIESRLRDNGDIGARQEALMREAEIVPVALDLGIVRVRRAQAMSDPQARREELEAAEKTFLAIRGLAGESDEYRLFLGQVCYWLGKHDEGRKLFDDLLVAHDRSHEMLMAVASTLRNVGASSETRALAEEAYNGETDQANKHQAALLRALEPVDLDDKILWLQRSNPANMDVKAALSNALGDRAIMEGKNELAAKHLREAIAVYAQQSQHTSTLNNAAMAYFSLFQATGEREAYDKATAMLERAVALDPSNSILLSNAATSILRGAVMDMIGNDIDLARLNLAGDMELLPYLYADESGYNLYRERVRTHPGIAQSLAYFDKVMVLRPKDRSAYSEAASIHAYTRDLDALRELHQRVQQAELDLTDLDRVMLDYYTGADDAKHRKEVKASIERFEKLVTAARAGPQDVTFTVAAGYLARTRVSASIIGLPVDVDAVVRLAEEADAAASSAATKWTVFRTLLMRAHRHLAEQDAAYANMASRAGRSLSPSRLIAVALSQPGPYRDTVLSNADVQRAMSLLIEEGRRFPTDRSSWEWAMLLAAHPDEAAKVAEAVRGDETGRIVEDIELALSPLSAHYAFDAYWSKTIMGDEAEGRQILERCAARGVPLPFDLD